METFAAVAEARSFSVAARALGISKGAVSKAIAALEDQLGCRLLNRSTRRVTLTSEGEVFLRSCQAVVEEAARAERAVRELHDAPRGPLRVNAPTAFASDFLGPILPEFLARHPGVSVELHGDDTYVDVAHGGWDVVVRVGRLRDSGLIARKLAPVRLAAVASPAYLAARGEPRRPQDLRDHECITYALSNPPDVWPLVRKGRRTSVRVRGALRTNNDAITRAALLAGAGIALLPSFVVDEDLRAGRLREVLRGWDAAVGAMYAVMPPSRVDVAKVRAFVDFLVQRVSATCRD
jgi:DNA-binding transcriptional LysR family regulator